VQGARAQRSAANNYQGDQTVQSVVEGNEFADIAAFLFTLAWARGVQVAIENTPGSLIWKYPSISKIVSNISNLSWTLTYRCCFDTAPFGERLYKPYKFLSSGKWLVECSRKCTCPMPKDPHASKHQKTVERTPKDTHKYGEAVRGKVDKLEESQRYPPRLGEAIIAAWLGRSLSRASEASSSSDVLVRPSWQACASDSEPDSAAPAAAASSSEVLVRPSWQVGASDSESASEAPPKKIRPFWWEMGSDEDPDEY